MEYNINSIIERLTNQRISTPVFVYNHELVLRQISTLKSLCSTITENFSIAYSYKTNPLLAPHICKAGCVLQVTSLRHLNQAMKLMAAKQHEDCFFNTASLTEAEAKIVVASSFQVVADSLYQIELVNRIGESLQKVVPFLIRIDTEIKIKDTPFSTSGAMLGLSCEQAERILSQLSKYKWLKFVGIHNHAASQNTNLESWIQNTRTLEKFTLDLPKDIDLQIVNLGGGFPISYMNSKKLPVEKIFSDALGPSIRNILKRFPNVKLVIEPGRFLVGPTGFLATQVTNLQSSSELEGAVVNASLFATFNDRLLSKMVFQPPIFSSQTGTNRYFIRGSSPASDDFFGIYNNLPTLKIADVIIFGMMGAYASAMGSDFSGVVRPSEYILEKDKLTLLRQ